MQYVFQCKKCGTIFEISASFSTILNIKTSCPNCHSSKVERKYLPLGFILKGKGFYKTENRGDDEWSSYNYI